MKYDFSEPRKQSASGIVVMFANSLQKTIRAIALPVILIAIKSKDSAHVATFIIIGLCLLTIILAVFAYFSYKKFTYFLDEDKQEFIINQGIFNRTTLSIQLNKIQQVNINQSLIQQMIGVYSLDIDTAGSEKKEASIKAIDHVAATVLKQRLLNRDSNPLDQSFTNNLSHLSAQAEESLTSPLFKLSTATLLKIGITSNYGASLLLLTGFIFGLLQLFKDYTAIFETQKEQINQAITKGFTLFSICFLIGFAILIILGTNIVRTFVKYFNFEIVKQNRSLAISSGLFNKKNVLLTPNKVQLSAYSQNYFQRKLNILNMKIKQASYNDADQEESKKSDIEIPGCNDLERNEVLKMIFHQLPIKGQELAPDYRFIFLQIMLFIVTPAILFILTAIFIYNPLKNYLILILPYLLIVAPMLYFEFKRHRLYVNDNFIIKKSGIWDVEHEIIETHKIQAITAKQYFWHKKADIGHLIVHTAAGVIHFKYGNYTHINSLVNYWLYKVESSGKDWM